MYTESDALTIFELLWITLPFGGRIELGGSVFEFSMLRWLDTCACDWLSQYKWTIHWSWILLWLSIFLLLNEVVRAILPVHDGDTLDTRL